MAKHSAETILKEVVKAEQLTRDDILVSALVRWLKDAGYRVPLECRPWENVRVSGSIVSDDEHRRFVDDNLLQ